MHEKYNLENSIYIVGPIKLSLSTLCVFIKILTNLSTEQSLIKHTYKDNQKTRCDQSTSTTAISIFKCFCAAPLISSFCFFFFCSLSFKLEDEP